MAANYDLPGVVEKRVRFFDGQFLQEQDFVDEQKYHLDRERRHLRVLHVAGIADGLAVAAKEANQVTIAPGTAIDSDGRQLALAQTATVDLPADRFNDKQDIELYLSYRESAEDEQTEAGSRDFTRWLERPELMPIAPGEDYAGATPPVLLARLALDNQGRVTVDDTVRSYSGLRLPGPAADAPTLRTTASGLVRMAGSLTVDGTVGIGATSPNSDLQIGDFQGRNRYLALKVQGGNAYRAGVRLWAYQENFGYSLEFDERVATGNGLHIRTHSITGEEVSRVFVGLNSNVGIGTTTPEQKLTVNGELRFTGGTTISSAGRMHIFGDEILFLLNRGGVVVGKHWGGNGNLHVDGTFTQVSDARLKQRIQQLESTLDRLTGIRGVSYLPRQVGRRADRSEERPAIGVLAQEVEAVFPQLVSTPAGDGYKAVDYNGLTAVLLEAVKELKTTLDALQARVAALRAHA